MATYNGQRYIRHSLASLLAQTFADFEIIVVDDGSTDATPDILAAIDDPRLRVVRNAGNLGVVESRNRCFAMVRGQYVAMLDHDDLSRPTRLARQVAYLDAHPDTVVLGTRAHDLCDGALSPRIYPAVTTPLVISWLMHVSNPLVCSSVMFRADAARRLDVFMRPQYEYADDFDFYHRMAAFGQIARLDERLTIYRLHASNTFRHSEEKMTANAVKVLAPALEPLLGAEAAAAADLIVRHLSAGAPVMDSASFALLCRSFDVLTRHFLALAAGDNVAQGAIRGHAHALWRRTLRVTTRRGGVGRRALLRARPLDFVPTAVGVARVIVGGFPPRQLSDIAKWALRRPARQLTPRPGRLFGRVYEPLPIDSAEPPRLFVVVDTEAEFDWHGPFAADLTNVTAMDEIERGQAIFDQYGLRPIYVIDYPIASQPRGFEPLRRIVARGGCAIGAHVHPWTNPPIEEPPTAENSFPGNLPPNLEARKLATLVGQIRTSFGFTPQFYRAGRYGFGPNTAEILGQLGITVDLSLLPGADLRFKHGPDFRRIETVPYRIAGTEILSMPMTRARVGLAPSLGLPSLQNIAGARLGPVPALLSRLGLEETVTLTPEGVTAEEQIRLVRALLRRGHKDFVLHYHSPSLSVGHTPYVRTEAQLQDFLRRLELVCAFFFEEVGGMPGNPQDLVGAVQAVRVA
jgi:glycosyltransferase involved in cell wall biosynthesis